MTEAADFRPSPPSAHAQRWTRGVRAAAATVLVVGPALQVAAWTLDPGEGAADPSAGNLAREELSLALNLASVPPLIGAVAAMVGLARLGSARLAWAGGGLFATGLAALGMLLGGEVVANGLGLDAAIGPAAVDAALLRLETLPTTVMNGLFLLGVGLGVPLTAAALWRSRAVPRAAAGLLVLFLVLDVAGQGAGTGDLPAQLDPLPVVAHVVLLLAGALIARVVLAPPPTAGGQM
jgi:hypothetical protein